LSADPTNRHTRGRSDQVRTIGASLIHQLLSNRRINLRRQLQFGLLRRHCSILICHCGSVLPADPDHRISLFRPDPIHRLTEYHREVAGARVAYQDFDRRPTAVSVPPMAQNVATPWDWPGVATMLERLGSFSRWIHFDKRGTGASERCSRTSPRSLATVCDDQITGQYSGLRLCALEHAVSDEVARFSSEPYRNVRIGPGAVDCRRTFTGVVRHPFDASLVSVRRSWLCCVADVDRRSKHAGLRLGSSLDSRRSVEIALRLIWITKIGYCLIALSSAAHARLRWLMVFFSAAVCSPKVRPSPSAGMNNES
jgi:hypothetical protein